MQIAGLILILSAALSFAGSVKILPATPEEFQAMQSSFTAASVRGRGTPKQADGESPTEPADLEARLAPTPEVAQGEYVVYGVIYDLATKAPIPDAMVFFAGETRRVTTDAHGWYRLSMKSGFPAKPVSVDVMARGYRRSPLMERNPPLASRSAGERRGIAEDPESQGKPIMFSLGGEIPVAELNLAMVPLVWPAGMPAAPEPDFEDPPVPDVLGRGMCRFYGVVYNLSTRKALRRLRLNFQGPSGAGQTTTNSKGEYVYDTGMMQVHNGVGVTAAAEGYRPGLMAERDPPMRQLSSKDRRDIADVSDLAFDPASLPTDCDTGVVRFDLVAVPSEWPKR